MPNQFIIAGRVMEDSGAFKMARIYGNAGTLITQASISAIDFSVVDVEENEFVTGPTALTVNQVVFDALQTSDPRWTQDLTGYNFGHQVPAAAFPDGGRLYHVIYKFTPASGEVFHLVYSDRSVALGGP